MNDAKKKLSIDDLQVDSFVSSNKSKDAVGGWTGDCGSFVNVTCPDPNCDFNSIPINECFAPPAPPPGVGGGGGGGGAGGW